jgi:hypothetical protein
MIALSVSAAFFIADHPVAHIRHNHMAAGSSMISPASTLDRNSAVQGASRSKLTVLWGVAPDGRVVSRWESQD